MVCNEHHRLRGLIMWLKCQQNPKIFSLQLCKTEKRKRKAANYHKKKSRNKLIFCQLTNRFSSRSLGLGIYFALYGYILIYHTHLTLFHPSVSAVWEEGDVHSADPISGYWDTGSHCQLYPAGTFKCRINQIKDPLPNIKSIHRQTVSMRRFYPGETLLRGFSFLNMI